jgi:feruloyl esterase
VSADLRGFKANDGKLLIYHGWADPVVPPEATIRYYEGVEKTMGGARNTSEFARLFMAPGMGHCTGGAGPNTFDALGVLDGWVASGAAPARMIASHATNGKIDRTRPLCPYPAAAEWKRVGSTDEAESFA